LSFDLADSQPVGSGLSPPSFGEGVRLFEAEIPLNTTLREGETQLVFEPLSQGQPSPSFHGIVGSDPAVRQLVELIQRVAPSTAVVTILGESGTGKQLVAKAPRICSSPGWSCCVAWLP
jgi:transcriptional regulator with GAF, ATPase, and Fis domain